MKIALLETSPRGPMEGAHDQFRDDPRFDVYDITHDEPYRGALFNPDRTWGANRNELWDRVPKVYDYYWFTDYDVNVMGSPDSVLTALESFNPALAYPSYINDVKGDTGAIRSGVFNNTMSVLVRHDVAPILFPLPVQFGGFWDCANYINCVALAWADYVIEIGDVLSMSMVSSPYAQTTDALQDMQDCFEWCREWLNLEGPTDARAFKAWARYNDAPVRDGTGMDYRQAFIDSPVVDADHDWFAGRL